MRGGSADVGELGLRGGGIDVSKQEEADCGHYHIEELGCELCAKKKVSKGFGGQYIGQRPILVGCAGGTASGKTSICEM